ncbi:cytochrome c [Iodidimonas gelatinilytica]|uniref:Cytochrome c n=2 Tax=Iodidimonas gelatinilytica TaxID=1236966 RepID=A0A5A7N0Y6_9PROT|nr:cytochrome c [Iodidimonas gelatinilytica]GER00819.1 cytochrome c [Iodidimonas gelatinilytica]
MDTMTVNKALAGILIALLLVKGSAILTEGRFHVEAPETPAYAVALPDVSADTEKEAEPEGPSLAMLLSQASADKGQRAFAKCAACHSYEKGGANKIGPNLYGVLGSAIASKPGFGYSDALANHGGEWTYEQLDAWLLNTNEAIPGNKMAFAGLRKPTDRANMIAFLRAQSDQPLPLPAVEEEAGSE